MPNALGRAGSYAELLELAHANGLGADLVVQTPYGDSGQTTFFVASADDWEASEEDLASEDLKVMLRIEPPVYRVGVGTGSVRYLWPGSTWERSFDSRHGTHEALIPVTRSAGRREPTTDR